MTEFLFITANDIHISDTNPRSRIDNFKDSILDKIKQMRMACNKLGADGAIIAGDLYNVKNPAKNSHQLNQELIREFKQFKCPIYMIEGNHDLTANNIDSLEEQPLGVLFADGTLVQLREEKIQKDGKTVSLVGVPYKDNLEPQDIIIPDKGDAIAQVLVLHMYASPTPGMLPKEKIHGYKDFLEMGPDVFIFGHYHLDQGVVEIENRWFINIGSLSRGTLREEEIGHQPQIGFIKISVSDENQVDYNIQTIKLKIKPASEVFDLEKRQEEKKEAEEIEIFVDKLVTEAISEDIKEDRSIEKIIENINAAKEVKEKVMYFLEAAAR